MATSTTTKKKVNRKSFLTVELKETVSCIIDDGNFQFWGTSFVWSPRILVWSKVELLVWFVQLPREHHHRPFSGRKMANFLTLTKTPGMWTHFFLKSKTNFYIKIYIHMHFIQKSIRIDDYWLKTPIVEKHPYCILPKCHWKSMHIFLKFRKKHT